MILGIPKADWLAEFPRLADLIALRPSEWFNPAIAPSAEALADVGLGYAMAFSREPPQPMVTVGLRLDFCGVARVGDWLEVHTRVDKLGQRMAFASARLHSGERLVASASGVFHLP